MWVGQHFHSVNNLKALIEMDKEISHSIGAFTRPFLQILFEFSIESLCNEELCLYGKVGFGMGSTFITLIPKKDFFFLFWDNQTF